jgi:hypothetical protein
MVKGVAGDGAYGICTMPTLLVALTYGGALTASLGFFGLSAFMIRNIGRG